MPDVSIIGSGPAARACDELLGRTGFEVSRAFEVDASERNPAIIGETAGAFAIARQLIGAGRHVLIASPLSLSASQLLALLAARSPKQALFLWSERRFHPGYRFIGGLAKRTP